MLKWLKSLFAEEKLTADELATAMAWRESRRGRPFFKNQGDCPFGKYALRYGVLSVIPKDVRHDN